MKNLSRRQFLRAAGVGAATVALSTPQAFASTARGSGRRKVAIFGGGVAGMSAAHELAERGFIVDLYEWRALGGKARSTSVAGTGVGGRLPLPGEHAWRSFFGYYANLPDTLRRIPVGRASVFDNLRETSEIVLARSDGRPDLTLPLVTDGQPRRPDLNSAVSTAAAAMQTATRLSAREAAVLGQRLAMYFTSCDERRFGQWERQSWWDYMRQEHMSDEYRAVANFIPKAVALKPPLASARSIGNYWELAVNTEVGLGNDGPRDGVLNAPTNEAWIDPWASHLRRLGARLHVGWSLDAIDYGGGRIVSARIKDASGATLIVDADWYVCALPVERARTFWTPGILAADPSLEGMHRIQTTWASGLQYYLRQPAPIAHGHVVCIDSPWAVMSISQAQFWDRDLARTYGDGSVQDCLSVAIAEFDTPGVVYGKTAKQCTPREAAREVWVQVQMAVDERGRRHLPDAILHSWTIDPGWHLTDGNGRESTQDDALFLNSVGSWFDRPEASTAIGNLFLAGDYTRTNIDAATMDGANESGRRAANAVLRAADSSAPCVRIYDLYRQPAFDGPKRGDQARFRRGQPHVLETRGVG